jgi:thiamine-monophosphate kinase
MSVKNNLTVAQLDEHELVRMILDVLSKHQLGDLIVQPGDDAAVLSKLNKPTVTSDILIEDVHFRMQWSSAADIGTRAAAANLADLIAMGAQPKALTVALGIPDKSLVSFVLDLMDAIAIESKLVGAEVVGGDVTRSEKFVISITAIGDCENRSPILRSGAQIGNKVGLIGRIGSAQAGLLLLKSAKSNPTELIAFHKRPKVDYLAARAAWSAATAMIDISDGLLADLGHISTAAKVRIDLRSDLILKLASTNLVQAANELNVNLLELMLSGGDDHAFAVCADELPNACLEIGTVGEGSGIYLDGKSVSPLGYRHFNG